MTKQPNKSLLTFPCDFTIKVFGLATDEFEAAAFGIVHKHAPNLSGRVIQSNNSAHGKYRSLSITVRIDSKEQLDNIYHDLSSSSQIIMAL